MSNRSDSFTLLGQREGEIIVCMAVIGKNLNRFGIVWLAVVRKNLNRFGKLRDRFV